MKKKIILIASILACVLVVGAVFSAFSFGSRVVTPTPNNSAPFGGVTLMKHVYNEDTDPTYLKDGYQAVDSMIMQASMSTYYYTSSKGISFSSAQGANNTNFYVRFLTAEDTNAAKEVKVSDFDYFTVDFDISGVSEAGFKVYTLFRNTSGQALGANENYCTLSGDKFYAGEKGYDATSALHVTLAYKFNAEDGYTVCNVFVDGDYAASYANPSSIPVSDLDYIEALVIGDGTGRTGNSFTVNNVEFNGFVKGYEGAVENMFKSPRTPLERNSDSVLYYD